MTNRRYRYVITNNKNTFLNAGYTFHYSIPNKKMEYFVFYNDGDESKIKKDDKTLVIYKNMLFL